MSANYIVVNESEMVLLSVISQITGYLSTAVQRRPGYLLTVDLEEEQDEMKATKARGEYQSKQNTGLQD